MGSKRTRSGLPWRTPRLGSPPQSFSEGKVLTAQRTKLRTRAGDASHFIPELLWVALLGREGLRPRLEESHLLKVLQQGAGQQGFCFWLWALGSSPFIYPLTRLSCGKGQAG